MKIHPLLFVAGIIACDDQAANAGTQLFWTASAPDFIETGFSDQPNSQSTFADIGTTLGSTFVQNITNDGKSLFWVDINSSNIFAIDLDGSNPRLFLDPSSTGSDYPAALTSNGGDVFWTDIGTNSIYTATRDGGNPHKLYDAPNPRSITTDGLYLYWSNGTAIHRANLDGSNNEAIYQLSNVGSLEPGDLATNGRTLFWTDSPLIGRDSIYRLDLASLTGERIYQSTQSDNYRGIAVVDSSIFWVDQQQAAIFRSDLDGQNVSVHFNALHGDADFITAVVPEPNTLALLVVSLLTLGFRRRFSA